MTKNTTSKKKYDYLTNLFRYHSILALSSGILTLILAFYGIIAGIIRSIEVAELNGFLAFIYFTMISNTIAALSISFAIPFAVEGIKKKHFVIPKWVALLHYISTTSIVITMIFVLAIMSWTFPEGAFEGGNKFLHIFCPILILISFFQIENRYIYTIKDRFIGCLPFVIYTIVYYIEVSIIGEANGGWPDIYQVLDYLSPIIAIPISLLFGLTVSWTIALISNYLTKKREEKMFIHWKKKIDPIEAKIEAYGLGNMMSQINDENSITIPLDILNYLAKNSKLNTDDLIKSYITGFINGKKV